MFKKVLRYILLYGFRRTLTKVLYKLDGTPPLMILRFMFNFRVKNEQRIGIVGLGNHGFTLIAFFVTVLSKKRFSFVIDPSDKSRILAEKVLCCRHFKTLDEAIDSGYFYGDLVYIASDHYSHTEQAIIATKSFKKVYVEKPIFVNYEQQKNFGEIFKTEAKVFTGFNRPYAPYFQDMKNSLGESFSISMVVNGHYLAEDHWYRNEGQGSRVLGNLTHWLDLSLRTFSLASLPEYLEVTLTQGNLDDISVTLKSGQRKIDLLFSANCEPVDGVEEFIFWNSNQSVGKIINFKSIDIFSNQGSRIRVNKRSKNVGHKDAVLAPLLSDESSVEIAYLSSFLALRIEEMYQTNLSSCTVQLKI